MSDFDNGLIDSETERLAILAEECGEVVQSVGKVLRHGYSRCNPLASNPISNRDLLAKEIGDLCWIISLMLTRGDVAEGATLRRERLKGESAKPYLHHQNIQADCQEQLEAMDPAAPHPQEPPK
jgi:NTP pyrophosphatase (non-canonical NTP hydrolase)